MARQDRETRGRRGGGGRRKKVCRFCVAPAENIIDYKNVPLLKRYLDDEWTIRKARQTGTCRKHQAQLANAIKRAREIALLPFVAE
ncbi:MAG: 30S ribosomal protein S18 [Armatimonadota bacterium]